MIFGIICVGYYFAICCYIRKWDSKFPRIWLALGVVSFLLGWRWERLPEVATAGLEMAGLIVLLIFAAVELLILSGMKEDKCAGEAEYIIVLGAKVDGYHLTDALKQRLDKALLYLRTHDKTKVIVSGGQGPEEYVTEAQAMAEYLIRCGVEPSRILKEEKSTTTRENLIFSGRIMREDPGTECMARTGIVTNNFHIYRAVCIAKQVGYQNVIALAAPTAPIMFVNYMTREFFGVLKMWAERKKTKVD